jgi:cytoskeletal protein RodZ
MEHEKAFGSYLRAERELRQVPLGEIAAATKIPLRTLESLELGRWDGLPAQVFVRGFVRAYAKHLGLPSEEVCRRYDNTLAVARAGTVEADPPAVAVGDGAAEVGGRRRMGLALFVIILLIIATITLSLIWRRGASANVHAQGEPPAPLATAAVEHRA